MFISFFYSPFAYLGKKFIYFTDQWDSLFDKLFAFHGKVDVSQAIRMSKPLIIKWPDKQEIYCLLLHI